MFSGLLNKAKGGLSSLAKDAGKGFADLKGLAGKGLAGLKGLGKKAAPAPRKAGGMFSGLLNKAKGGLAGLANKAKSGLAGLANRAAPAPRKAGGMFSGLLNKAKGFGAKGLAGLTGLGGKIKGGIAGFGNSIKSLLNKGKGGATPKMAPLSPDAIAANAKGKAFCSANCIINPASAEKKCLDGGKLVPCKRCTGAPGKDASMKSVCELVCNGNLPQSPCDFYGYVNNKKKGVNLAILTKYGLKIVRRKYRQN